MCTVIFLPSATKVTFVSCRDEDPGRPAAAAPGTFLENNTKLVYPKDAAAGGTWIGVNEYGHVLVLLNGAFDNHVRETPYLKSRGLIVKELLGSQYPIAYWYRMPLQQIEPFTLIIWANKTLYQLVWDGTSQHHFEHDSQLPHIWSSATLYDDEARDQRRNWFQYGINHHLLSDAKQIYSFLQSHNDEQIGFVMNRQSNLATLSISIIEQEKDTTVFNYFDLGNNSTAVESLKTLNQINA